MWYGELTSQSNAYRVLDAENSCSVRLGRLDFFGGRTSWYIVKLSIEVYLNMSLLTAIDISI